MVFSENAANILLDLTLLNHCLLCRCVSQDVAVQCCCVSQELAEETSESLCMVVVKLDVLQQEKVIVRLLLVGAFTRYWLELQSDHNLLYDYRVQRPDWPQKTVQHPVFLSQLPIQKIDGTVTHTTDTSRQRQGTYLLELPNQLFLAFYHCGRQLQLKSQHGYKI